MIWRPTEVISTAMILVAFLVAGLVVWYSPLLLDPLGLGEFVFVGQLCLTVLVLSVLDRVFARLPGSAEPTAVGEPHDPGE